MNKSQLNVFGKVLKTCSDDPLTGFFRDGCCNSSVNDKGEHTVCAIVSDKFLKFSLSKGNDLITPREEFNFSHNILIIHKQNQICFEKSNFETKYYIL